MQVKSVAQAGSDDQLLRQYAQQGNEAAFREIVERHTNLVYSAALRQVDSPDLASDVSQTVFTDLARKARSVADNMHETSSLVGWLYRATRFEALNVRRSELRRHSRERKAMEQLNSSPENAPDWDRLRPVLDESMAELTESDRGVLLLRFFQNQDLRQVGAALGVSDDAAQKRVSRALEKLRDHLGRRGISAATGTLAIVISSNAVQSAPVGLACALAGAALAGSAVPTSTVIAVTKAITMTTLQKTIVGATLAAAVGTGIYEAQRASKLDDQNQKLAAQVDQLARERDAALSNAAPKDNLIERAERDQNELLQLRGETGALRRQTNELAKLQRENRQLRDSLSGRNQTGRPPEPDPDAEAGRQMAIAKMNDSKLLVLGWLMYASDHQDQLPEHLDQTSNYWTNADTPLTGTNQFELVSQGSLKGISNPATTIVVREKEPMLVNGKLLKAYGFADGHSEYKTEPPEGFEAWEKQHMMPQ